MAERKSPLRGVLDLLAGAYPAFVFGGPVGRQLPVFHFHEVTPDYLKPYLRYLAENGYRTVTSEAVARWVKDGVHPGDRSVVLCFDDAWASLWTVAAPLLKRHGLTAITFAIPGRTTEGSPRPRFDESGSPASGFDRSDTPFCTWSELQALQTEGVVDIQSHTYAHARVFSDEEITGFVTADYQPHVHDRPLLEAARPPVFLSASALGAPLYTTRSRMSDALRYDDPGARERARSAVEQGGGAAFFQRPDWRQSLQRAVGQPTGRYESPAEREQAILEDLAAAREILNQRLRTTSVRHICFPWAVAGQVAEQCARRAGYETAWADRMGGRHAVRAGDNPYRLMRLKHKYIFKLPRGG